MREGSVLGQADALAIIMGPMSSEMIVRAVTIALADIGRDGILVDPSVFGIKMVRLHPAVNQPE